MTQQATSSASLFWSLYRRCLTLEDDSLKQRLRVITEYFQVDAEALEDRESMNKEIDEILSELICERLIANDRGVPLIAKRDIAKIIAGLTEGETITKELLAEVDLLRQMVTTVVTSAQRNLTYRRAEDHYDAFWRWVVAVVGVAQIHRLSPEQVVELKDMRAQVFAKWMTREDWQEKTDAVAAEISQLPLDVSLQPIIDSLPETEQLRVMREVKALNPTDYTLFTMQIAGVFADYRNERAAEIWPTT